MEADQDSPESAEQARFTGNCARPFKTASGLYVRCQSRVKSKCPSRAELYRGDWAAIARSGVFDGPAEQYRFYLLTLTAPSFGRVHRVPRSPDARGSNCGCGALHSSTDVELRGVPLDPTSYDYLGQVAWNRDAGVLWDNTRRRLRDRWPSVEFFLVREWQDRGVLHLHALMRIERAESPQGAELGEAARSAVGFSKVDGALVEWGEQVQCDAFRTDGDGAKTIWYLSKALNYVMKDTARESAGGPSRSWEHLVRLQHAARSIRCSRGCMPRDCSSVVHERVGSRSHVVSASRRTKTRSGWSFTGMTRTLQRRLRSAWVAEHGSPPPERTTENRALAIAARESLADRSERELLARAAVVP